jgi:rod shape-determining protein MreD
VRTISGDQVLLPVNPLFMWVSLVVALCLNLLPIGREPRLPDFIALVLVFWNIHQPRRVGVGVAFVFGVFMDVHESALLGQHALAYTLLSYFAITIHRRVLWFGVFAQSLQLLPLFVSAHAISLLVRLATGGAFPGWDMFYAPLIEAALWAPVSWTLLAPQRRPPDSDAHRPL